VRVWREGVLRTCSVAYSLDNLDDEFCHLSNHCIQVHSAAFGEHEATNEMFYAEFGRVLGGTVLRDNLLPQAHRIIVECLLAARDTLEANPELGGVGCFNVFGVDLMVDEDLSVKLIEVNSSPAVADELVQDLVADLAKVQLNRHFSAASSSAGSSSSAPSNDDGNGWELVYSAERDAALA